MRIQEILRFYRMRFGYTQQALADALHVSTQAVSQWETGTSLPSIDNLLALSDLYGISIDELIQAGPHFHKPYTVGKLPTRVGLILRVAIWLLASLAVTAWGSQFWSWPVFTLLQICGLFLVLPTTLGDYWVIERTGIRVHVDADFEAPVVARRMPVSARRMQFSANPLREIKRFWNPSGDPLIPYSAIKKAELSYKQSPVQPNWTGGDDLFLFVTIESGVRLRLPIEVPAKPFLPQFWGFLQRQHITLVDSDDIIGLVVRGESIYDALHE